MNNLETSGNKNALSETDGSFCPTTTTKILRLPDVIARVGLKRASIYKAISQSTFPKPIALGKRSVGWVEQEIENWLVARINASRQN